MNPSTQNPLPGSAEETLRLIASLPAPSGLAERVQAFVQADLLAHAHSSRGAGRVLHWQQPTSAWMRSAAAAAIVFVIAGGGWGIYSHVQKAQPERAVVPPHGAASGGFNNAGAMRTPNTLNGPVVASPGTDQLPHAKESLRSASRPTAAPLHRAHSAAASKSGNQAAGQTGAPLAK